jgi:HD superfamily phosphohydrolase YqeK
MINSIKYPRGSEWRKWDLHVHTPFSYLNNQFGDDFDNYVKKLFKKAIEKEIAVIGITDYFCIEGYKKIKTDYLTNEKKLKELFSDEEIEKIKKITLFPNIEFRLDTLVGSNRVNFHVLFSDRVQIKDIEENFLHELDFVYEGNPQSEDEKWPLKLANIEELGENLKKEHKDFRSKTNLFIGMQCAVVNDSQIAKVLKNKRSKFEGKYILCVPSDEDLSEISWNGQDHNVRKTLIQKSDVLFSSNHGTISWGLGKHSTRQEFIDEFKTLKPCIWGSDAHDYKKLFEPDDNRYTWIKADTTFEGLKQITYEPDERVIIQEIKPDEKLSYQVIDSVIFKNENFIDSKIGLNQNLISIIGDKSAGKSILLRSVARSIDLDQVQIKYDNIKEPSLEDPVMEINWKDGKIDNESIKTGRKIIYIPQTFLNEKIDKNEPNSFINTILHDVLIQKTEFRQVIEKIEHVEKDINNSINDKINNIFLVQDKISEATKRVSELGNKEYIEKEITKLDEECEMLHKQGGATPEDIELYNLRNKEFSNKIRSHSAKFENLKNLGLILNTADSIKSSELINFQIPHFKSLDYDLQEEITKKFVVLKKSTKMAISFIFKQKFNEIYSEIKILKNQLEEVNEALNPLKNKLDFSDAIKKKADLLKNEEQKLINLNEEMNSLTRLKSEFEKTIDDTIKLNADYENKLNDLKKQLPSNIFIDVNFTIDILFNESKFNDTMKDLLNSKKFSAFKEKKDIDLSNFRFANSSDFNLSLKKIIIGILEKTVRFLIVINAI